MVGFTGASIYTLYYTSFNFKAVKEQEGLH